MSAPDLAIVVITFQMPWHLRRCLASIAAQRTRASLEVIISDDGSTDETSEVVAEFAGAAPFDVRFVTHPHVDFHAARTRNSGARLTTAKQLLFVDGDCLLPADHVEHHLRLARPGIVTSGYCVRLDEQTSNSISLEMIESGAFIKLAPAHELAKLASMHRKAWWYSMLRHPTKPALRSTDFSVSRRDFERVNGFDEQFTGWGCEDDDLGRRLRASGVRLRSILDRTFVFHLWHPPAPSKPLTWREGRNVNYLEQRSRPARCVQGLAHDRASVVLNQEAV